MSGHQLERLQAAILALSDSADWPTARAEWDLTKIEIVDDPEHCPCGQFPILELCILRNRKTDKRITVGNRCVHRFLGIASENYFDGVRRIIKNPAKSVGANATVYFHQRGILTDWERKFGLDTVNRHNLTEKSTAIRQRINQKIIAYVTGVIPTGSGVKADMNGQSHYDRAEASRIACTLDMYKIHSLACGVTSYELACLVWDSLIQAPGDEECLVYDLKAEAREFDRLIDRIGLYRHTKQSTVFDNLGAFTNIEGKVVWRWFYTPRERPKVNPKVEALMDTIKTNTAAEPLASDRSVPSGVWLELKVA